MITEVSERVDLVVAASGQVRCDVALACKRRERTRGDRSGKFGLSQADLYQLLAYGQRYLGAKGEMALLYPKTRVFTRPLPVFSYSADLRLWVLPFDLETDRCIDLEVLLLPLRKSTVSSAFAP